MMIVEEFVISDDPDASSSQNNDLYVERNS
jgi:hypothetical protein